MHRALSSTAFGTITWTAKFESLCKRSLQNISFARTFHLHHYISFARIIHLHHYVSFARIFHLHEYFICITIFASLYFICTNISSASLCFICTNISFASLLHQYESTLVRSGRRARATNKKCCPTQRKNVIERSMHEDFICINNAPVWKHARQVWKESKRHEQEMLSY